MPWLEGQVCTHSHAENPDRPGGRGPLGSLIQSVLIQQRQRDLDGELPAQVGEKQAAERVCTAGREVGAMQQGGHSESERPRVRFGPGATGHRRAVQLCRLAPCRSRVYPLHYSHPVICILRQLYALRRGRLSHRYKDASSLLFVICLFLHFLHLPGTSRRQRLGLATERTVSKHLLSG